MEWRNSRHQHPRNRIIHGVLNRGCIAVMPARLESEDRRQSKSVCLYSTLPCCWLGVLRFVSTKRTAEGEEGERTVDIAILDSYHREYES
jgi:hypothetical protein